MNPTEDTRFMRMALKWARRGGFRVSPNPQVGCVLVKSGRVVGTGFHSMTGGPHAEVQALKKAGKKARGATAYVNLEPCCHTDKKTPPCVPALVAAGVRRVVMGMTDPNPKVSGRGAVQLRKAGIKISNGTLEAECKTLNRPFIIRMKNQRPYVILKVASSLDGKLATTTGESKWITSSKAREAVHRMRAQVDAVLVGIGTVLSDNPNLTSHGAGKNPMRVVLDSRLRTSTQANILNDQAPTLIFTSIKNPAAKLHSRPGLSIIRVPKSANGLSLRDVLRHLFARGIGTLLVEGGSHIHTAFLDAGIVDEVRLFLAPILIGGSNAAGYFEGRGIARLKHALRLSDFHVHKVGPDLSLTGYLGNI